jgi:hypothetical protein
MSGGPDALDLIDDPSWLEEPLCGLPEEAVDEGKGLLGLVPVVSQWLNSSAATTGGRVTDAIISGGGAVLLSKGLGAILHVPFVGSVLDALVSKGLKKAGIDFSLKGSLNYGTRQLAMAIEGKVSGRREGAAVLKAQALMGNLGDIGQAISSR